jgi:hypothetical protein
MGMLKKLYAVERKARKPDMSPEERHVLRLDESLLVMNELGKWIVKTYKAMFP